MIRIKNVYEATDEQLTKAMEQVFRGTDECDLNELREIVGFMMTTDLSRMLHLFVHDGSDVVVTGGEYNKAVDGYNKSLKALREKISECDDVALLLAAIEPKLPSVVGEALKRGLELPPGIPKETADMKSRILLCETEKPSVTKETQKWILRKWRR